MYSKTRLGSKFSPLPKKKLFVQRYVCCLNQCACQRCVGKMQNFLSEWVGDTIRKSQRIMHKWRNQLNCIFWLVQLQNQSCRFNDLKDSQTKNGFVCQLFKTSHVIFSLMFGIIWTLHVFLILMKSES